MAGDDRGVRKSSRGVRSLSPLCAAGLSHMEFSMRSAHEPCLFRVTFQRVVPANAGTHTARTLVLAPAQRPFFTFEARGDGSLRSQGRPAERLCETTIASTRGSIHSYAIPPLCAGRGWGEGPGTAPNTSLEFVGQMFPAREAFRSCLCHCLAPPGATRRPLPAKSGARLKRAVRYFPAGGRDARRSPHIRSSSSATKRSPPPDGQISLFCGFCLSSPVCKNISLSASGKSNLQLAPSCPIEGRCATSRTRGEMRWTRMRFRTKGAEADGEVVWS